MTWTLNLGDCLDPVSGLASLADKSVDHVISDPPYSRDLYARTRTNKGHGKRPNGRPVSRGEGTAKSSSFQLESNRIGSIDDMLDGIAAHSLRVARRWIIVFSDFEITHRWRTQFGAAYVRTGIWVKTDPMPQVSGDRPAQGFEPATIAHAKGRKRWNGGGRPATWVYGVSKGAERPDHPCPKPLALMRQLVEDFTDPGDLILDPFTGSGTTGIACAQLGRRFIGWELDASFHAIATRRLNGERAVLNDAQPELFGARQELP